MANICQSPLCHIAKSEVEAVVGDTEMLAKLCSACDSNGFNALHCAAGQNDVWLCRQLLTACPGMANGTTVKAPENWLPIHCLADHAKVH